MEKIVGFKPNLQATVDFGQNYTHIDSLYGGNDTYIYNIGDGNKYIVDLGGNDTIQFGVGITTENRKIHEETIELKQAA